METESTPRSAVRTVSTTATTALSLEGIFHHCGPGMFLPWLLAEEAVRLSRASSAFRGFYRAAVEENAALRRWWKDQHLYALLGCDNVELMSLLQKMYRWYTEPAAVPGGGNASEPHLGSSLDVDELQELLNSTRTPFFVFERMDDEYTVYDSAHRLFECQTVNLFGVETSFGNASVDQLQWMNYPEDVLDQLRPSSSRSDQEQTDCDENSDDGNGPGQSPKKRKIQCCRCHQAQRTQLPTPDNRLVMFEINGRLYCHECMDDDIYLQARFGKEHGIGADCTQWIFSKCHDPCDLNLDPATAKERFFVSIFSFYSMGPTVQYVFAGRHVP